MPERPDSRARDEPPARHRALSPSEKRLLAARIRELGDATSRVRKALAMAGVIVALLWIATLAASDAPWWVASLFWLAFGALLLAWLRRDLARDGRLQAAMADRLRSALRADRAEVLDVRARRFIEFEEVEDEGACYAFELGEGEILLLHGQEFYPEARFPSLDFSLVHPLDESGVPADFWIEKRGERASPERTVSAQKKWTLELPESLTVVRGDLDRFEDDLPRL